MLSFFLLIFSITLGVIGQLSLKQGMLQAGVFSGHHGQIVWTFVRVFQNLYVLSGFLCYGISSISWLIVISRLELSFAYPMISLGYVMVMLLSRLVFKEPLSPAKLLGTFIICLGVFVLSRHR